MRRMRTILAAAALGSLATLFQTVGLSAATGNVILGPIQYQRTANPTKLSKTFSAPHQGPGYIVRILNGGDHGQFKRVSKANVFINGRLVFKVPDFQEAPFLLETPIELVSGNDLAAEIYSEPGTGFTIVITGKEDSKDTTPPTIQGMATPARERIRVEQHKRDCHIHMQRRLRHFLMF